MNPYVISCAPTNATVGSVGASHSPGAGAILIDGTLATGGVATLGAAQLITLVSGGNDLGITFTITGTDAEGDAQTETVTGASGGTATSAKYFKTVTGITHTGSVATTLSAGNAVTAISPVFKLYKQAQPSTCGVGCVVTGTITYTLQNSYDAIPQTNWVDNTTVSAKTANFEDNYTSKPAMAVRIRVTAATTGTVTASFVNVRY